MVSAQGPKLRVFVDSSVLMAAAISGNGSARDLVQAAFDGHIDLWVSPLVIEECTRNLAKKAPLALGVLTAFLSDLPVSLADPERTLVERAAALVELKDAAIVAGAMQAEAPVLASYDRRHLLSQAELIEREFGVRVMTPDAILKTVS